MLFLKQIIPVLLQDYNEFSKTPMNLVMFRFAVEHISKVARILKMDNGNAMLIGIGGSGRQSCSRMATFLADYDIFQIFIAKG